MTVATDTTPLVIVLPEGTQADNCICMGDGQRTPGCVQHPAQDGGGHR